MPLEKRSPPPSMPCALEAAARPFELQEGAKEHVTPAVSQVKLLEEHVGRPHFAASRALELTAQPAMLPMCARAGKPQCRGAASARPRRPALTVIAPPNFAARWLVPRLAGFTGSHPSLAARLPPRDDRRARGRPGSAGGRCARRRAPGDGAVRQRPLSRPAGRRGFGGHVAVCSPKLLKGKHALRTPEDLRFHTLLHDGRSWTRRAPELARLPREGGREGHRLTRGPTRRS
jgi:LysR family glycine cleavage system transcriptional activator